MAEIEIKGHARTDFIENSENRLGQTVSCNSNDYQSNTYITISFLVKNDVYMCLFLTYLKVQISQDALGKCAFHFVI